jgi:hypothetical protein
MSNLNRIPESNETDSRAHKPPAPIVHACRAVMRPLPLHPRKRILDMLRPQRRARLGRGQEQGIHRQRILDIVVRAAFAAPLLRRAPEGVVGLALAEEGRGVVVAQEGLFEGFLDGETGECEGAHHFEGEEADDVDCVVVGFEIELRREVEEVAEAFGCGQSTLT